jgi:hypothetical protein
MWSDHTALHPHALESNYQKIQIKMRFDCDRAATEEITILST